MVMQKGLKPPVELLPAWQQWQNYLNVTLTSNKPVNNPEKEWEIILSEASGAPPEPSLLTEAACKVKKKTRTL